jgi:site-specific DNA-methyltransferase (adenine-specific)
MLNQIIQGDCLELLPTITAKYEIAAIVSDPPYGGNYNTDYTRFSGGAHSKGRKTFKAIKGDEKPFDPSPWLDFPEVILWGSNHYQQRLPVGTNLIWLKKPFTKRGKFLSDCEMAWQKGGYGIYAMEHIWDGFNRESSRGLQTLHPSEKPVPVMSWCIRRLNLPKGSIILDPYAGSGSTGVAAIELGFNFIGCELEPDYVEPANRRLALAQMQGRFEEMVG